MSVKVTIEFENVESAVVALGKIAGLPAASAQASQPAAEKPGRKPRADRGQQRDPYGPRTEPNAAGASTASVPGAASTGGAAAPAGTAGNSTGATTDTSSTAKAAAGASTSTTASAPGGGTIPGTPPAPSTTAAAAPSAPAAKAPSADDVQAAVEKLFNAKGFDDTAATLSRFGVKRGKDLPEAQRVEFIRRAIDVAEGKYASGAAWPDLT